mmetsp:Transcript_48362/g.122086  ORF Transcript_48362/g.122086 Transcript_48362/m.122086 type:complete len:223 (-) Transcript_48362:50-718(-)
MWHMDALPRRQTLLLPNNKLGNRGISILAEALGNNCCRLSCLDISRCGLSDGGASRYSRRELHQSAQASQRPRCMRLSFESPSWPPAVGLMHCWCCPHASTGAGPAGLRPARQGRRPRCSGHRSQRLALQPGHQPRGGGRHSGACDRGHARQLHEPAQRVLPRQSHLSRRGAHHHPWLPPEWVRPTCSAPRARLLCISGRPSGESRCQACRLARLRPALDTL